MKSVKEQEDDLGHGRSRSNVNTYPTTFWQMGRGAGKVEAGAGF